MVRNDSGEERTASSDICWGKGEKSLFGHIDTTNRELPYGTIFQTHNGVKTLMCLIWRCVLISSLSNAPCNYRNSEDAPGRLNNIFV